MDLTRSNKTTTQLGTRIDELLAKQVKMFAFQHKMNDGPYPTEQSVLEQALKDFFAKEEAA